MGVFTDGIRDALQQVAGGDRVVVDTTLRTLRVGVESTAFACLAGVPVGVAAGLERFRGRRVVLALANAGIRTPPVALGMALLVLMWPDSRWGGGLLSSLGWVYTLNAVILAQTLLVLPIVVALTATAVQAVPVPLLEQARAFGAGRVGVGRLALREARVGVLAAVIAAFGSAVAAVGAILVVGGSVGTATLSTAALSEWNMGGRDTRAVAYGTVMLGLFLIVAALLTRTQNRDSPWIPGRAS